MKKLNMKKLNQFYMNSSNAEEVRVLVSQAVENFVHAEVKNPSCIQVLNDLGLLMEA
jgi:hypothetical protein